jgi:dolichol-phosphate mannosyltransferase
VAQALCRFGAALEAGDGVDDRKEGNVLDLSIVVPFFDEEENVVPVVAELVEKLGEKLEYELILVDDGSRDGTPERLEEVAASLPNARVLRHRANRGKSAALITGVEASKAPWIGTMDGDGQNDPDDIVRLYRELQERRPGSRVRLVAGRRRRRRDTWLKRISSRIANRVRARLLGDDTPDTACGLKVFSRRAFLALPKFDNMHRFLPALFLREGYRAVSIDVDDRLRLGGESKYGLSNRLWVGVGDLLGVMWLQRRAMGSGRAADSGES